MPDAVKVIGIGAGGHAKVVIDLIQLLGRYQIVGLLDPNRELWGTTVLGVPVLGGDALMSELHQQGVRASFIGVGGTGDTRPRRRLYEQLLQKGFELVTAIHPQAVVAGSVQVGDGPTIMAGAIVNPGTVLGADVLVNTGAIIEHDCVIGDHVHIASGARLAGGVQVAAGTHIGLGACIRQSIRVGTHCLVAAGAVVVDDVPDEALAMGVPARAVMRVDR